MDGLPEVIMAGLWVDDKARGKGDAMKTLLGKLAMILTAVVTGALALVGLLQAAGAVATTTADAPRAATANNPGVGWVLTTNFSDSNISLVNGQTQAVTGPLFAGELGDPNGLIEVAITPDGQTALLANYGDQAIYYLNLSDPRAPTLSSTPAVSTALPYYADDIAITPDGRFALVTDGSENELVMSIDLASRTLVDVLDMGTITPTHDAQAIEIAPDGTVIYADLLGGAVGTLAIDPAGQLSHLNSYTYTINGVTPAPVNIYVAPEEHTVIVCDKYTSTLSVFQIQTAGQLTFEEAIPGLSTEVFSSTPGVQSLAFDPTSDLFYAVINGRTDLHDNPLPDQVAVLEVQGPGGVFLLQAAAVNLPRATERQFYGVETAAILGDNLYLGYPSSAGDGPPFPLLRVDLTTWAVEQLDLGGKPVGVGVVLSPWGVKLPLVER